MALARVGGHHHELDPEAGAVRPSNRWSPLALFALLTACSGSVELPKESLTVALPVSSATFAARFDSLVAPTLAELGLEPEDVVPEGAFGALPRRRIAVPWDLPLLSVNLEVTRLARSWGGDVLAATEIERGRAVEMTIGFEGQPVAELTLWENPRKRRRFGRVAIIIDDCGYRAPEEMPDFAELPQQVTLSILPHQRWSAEIARLALEHGHPVMVHLPMEPDSYPEIDPGKGAIFVSQSDEEVVLGTRAAIESIPGATGMNNHMGSRATRSPRVMRVVLEEAKRRRLFFVDSRTTDRSVALDVARELGVPARAIRGYIDPEDDPQLVLDQVLRLVEALPDSGSALFIGHDRPNTWQALDQCLPMLERQGYDVVAASSLVR